MRIKQNPKLSHKPFIVFGSCKEGYYIIEDKKILLNRLPIAKLQLMAKACGEIIEFNSSNNIRMRDVKPNEPFLTWQGIINVIISQKLITKSHGSGPNTTIKSSRPSSN